MLLAVGWSIAVTMILPKGIFHFHELVITTYTNGTMDFSTDATILVRSLGIVSLLTLILGLVIGATMGLTASSVVHVKEKMNDYEHALAAAGFMKITPTPDGVTYQLTEHGRHFLREYAFLDRDALSVHELDRSPS
jgi:hypothetical protein